MLAGRAGAGVIIGEAVENFGAEEAPGAFFGHRWLRDENAMPNWTLIRWPALFAAALALPVAAAAAPPPSAPTIPPVAATPLSPVTPQPHRSPPHAATPQPSAAAQPATAAPSAPGAQPASATAAAAASPGAIAVTAWGVSQHSPRGMAEPPPSPSTVTGGPLYIWLTLDGGQAAVDQLQGGTPLGIQIHWTSQTPAVGAPDAVTNLTVGRPDLAPVLAGEVQRTGHFVWHSWARKDTLSPGRWTVSLTDASGQPLQCGTAAPRPCQISFEVGTG